MLSCCTVLLSLYNNTIKFDTTENRLIAHNIDYLQLLQQMSFSRDVNRYAPPELNLLNAATSTRRLSPFDATASCSRDYSHTQPSHPTVSPNQPYRLNSSTLLYLSTKQVRSCRDYKMSVIDVSGYFLWILRCS